MILYCGHCGYPLVRAVSLRAWECPTGDGIQFTDLNLLYAREHDH